MHPLDDAFVASAQRTPVELEYGGKAYTFRSTNATRGGVIGYHAELEVIDPEGSVIGYITPYGSSERGAVKARFLDIGAPAIFRTAEDALREITSP